MEIKVELLRLKKSFPCIYLANSHFQILFLWEPFQSYSSIHTYGEALQAVSCLEVLNEKCPKSNTCSFHLISLDSSSIIIFVVHILMRHHKFHLNINLIGLIILRYINIGSQTVRCFDGINFFVHYFVIVARNYMNEIKKRRFKNNNEVKVNGDGLIVQVCALNSSVQILSFSWLSI
jgi:hypothetical protein